MVSAELQRRGLLMTAALLTGGLVLGACSPKDGAKPSGGQAQQSVKAFNRADETFVTSMLPQVRQAYDLSDNVIAKTGVDQPTLQLAGAIRDTASAEDDTFSTWIKDRRIEAPDQNENPGDLTWEELQAVVQATGAEVHKPYAEAMVTTHRSVVGLARTLIDDGADPDLRAMAGNIIDAREAQIEQLRRLI